jgi:hypothetical protein
VFSRNKLVGGDLSGALPQCFYVRDRSVDLGLPQMRFGHDPGYRATMSGDDNRNDDLNSQGGVLVQQM